MSNVPTLQGLLGRSGVQLGVAVLLLATLVVVGSARRRGRRRVAAAISAIALVTSVTTALALTLRPAVDGPAVRTLHLDPIEGAWGWDSIAWNPVIDNVALFVPIGALAAALWWRRSTVMVWLAAVALSLGIESAQFLLATGRVANMADVLANGTGAALGILLAVLLGVRVVPDRPGREARSRELAAR